MPHDFHQIYQKIKFKGNQKAKSLKVVLTDE